MAVSSFWLQAYHSPAAIARKVPVFIPAASLQRMLRTAILAADETKLQGGGSFFYGQLSSGHRHWGVQRTVHPWLAGRGQNGPGGGAPVCKPAGAPKRPRLLGSGAIVAGDPGGAEGLPRTWKDPCHHRHRHLGSGLCAAGPGRTAAGGRGGVPGQPYRGDGRRGGALDPGGGAVRTHRHPEAELQHHLSAGGPSGRTPGPAGPGRKTC